MRKSLVLQFRDLTMADLNTLPIRNHRKHIKKKRKTTQRIKMHRKFPKAAAFQVNRPHHLDKIF